MIENVWDFAFLTNEDDRSTSYIEIADLLSLECFLVMSAD